jgi:hypothetical protein
MNMLELETIGWGGELLKDRKPVLLKENIPSATWKKIVAEGF